jgi:signal transduction histidine kinase
LDDIQQKIRAVQNWLSELEQSRVANLDQSSPLEVETALNHILTIITPVPFQPSAEQGVAEMVIDLATWVQEQTQSLTQANADLKAQIIEQELAEMTVGEAHKALELRLKKHIADLSRLNQLLQEQILEQKKAQSVEREERVLTDALRDTLTTMSSTLDLGKVLDHILDNVERVAPYDGANVLFVESDLVHVVRQRGYVQKEQEKEWLNQRIPLTKLATLQQMIDLGKALAIPDIADASMWIGFPGLDWIQSNVSAPIRSNGKVLGFLSLDSATRGYFTQAHAERLQSFADQAAIAIQNARLLDRAKRAAVTAERNRIASELHDTLSQTLWSVSLIAERLPAIWEIDKQKGRLSLATVHQLAQSALEEMRVLLLELRPTAITDKNLGDLIRQLAIMVGNRAGLDVKVHIESQTEVPNEVHFVLYRVAQEALNNIVRHALAHHAEIYFKSELGRVDLMIHDDGRGFDPNTIEAGHLGLSIMQDRIQDIGGTLEITSDKQQGTLLKVLWQAPSPKNVQ